MRILFVSSEAYPLIKTGGLADVSGSLPAALQQRGVDVRILIPGYPAVLEKLQNSRPVATLQHLPLIGTAELILGEMPDTGVPVLAIQCPGLYQRAGGPYIDAGGRDWEDNPLRFGILSRIAALLGSPDTPLQDWQPDIVHCNDWQTGLVPAYMRFMRKPCAKSLISLHNMAFQGCYPPSWVERLGLPGESYQMEGLEYHQQMSFLKAGIFYADGISTVSPSYAREIQTETFGFGMQGLLAKRSHDIRGILNGIETEEWNPANDPHLVNPYDANHLAAKKTVKKALQAAQGLQQDAQAPLLGVVSRLTYQKGLDVFLSIAAPLVEQGCQIVVLGGGDAGMEAGFRDLATRYPQRVSVTIGYNEPLSHQIMAGADMFIMPSRFEPCGLNQMYGLRYGTPPIVTRTGGLADSVIDSNDTTLANHTASGFVIEHADAGQLHDAINRACAYYADSKTWRKIQRNGMRLDLGWDHSAQAYLDLYAHLLRD
ncbi:glycogen synthase GlgA [Pseudomethylobacillus aquaticus]|uniref:Glycogen synthase n=1 Tax=Pseudomethylobacillus aquaticus TaxID=2676064 RepID=A0A3N0V7A3_9PROT|nr:glycogen synthase GlgA [Pseudomethylobacillus aquaticus]ROH88268.1 glycogen synthase GlgA [Pseudomethylobacillus aquaticus]